MKTMQKGFTLIELMIVIAIIGILAAIAIPQYNDYVARSQASAALAEVTGGRTAYEELFQRGKAITGPGDIGLQTSTTRCSTIAVNYNSSQNQQGSSGSQDGAITCTIQGNPDVNNKYIELDRTTDGAYQCDTDLAAEYQPEGCS